MKKLRPTSYYSLLLPMQTPIWKQSSYIRPFTSTLIRLPLHCIYLMRVRRELYVPTFSYSLEQTYKLALATNDRSKDIVNTIWATHEYSIGPRLENSLILIKQGLRNEETRSEVIEACDALDNDCTQSFSLDVSYHGHEVIRFYKYYMM